MLLQLLRIQVAGGALRIDSVEVSSLQCERCAMTYEECLMEGLGVDFCKRRYLTCPRTATAELSITVQVSVMVGAFAVQRGTVEFEAGASYRETDTPYVHFEDRVREPSREQQLYVRLDRAVVQLLEEVAAR